MHSGAGPGYPRGVNTANEPNPYGYAGGGTSPDPRLEDLEDTAESITVPDDLAEPMGDTDDEQ
ncbi:hypothetical protein GCM10022251_55130 [Phytohabitans flavus]|uniref:Uncharacterized protein n=1 Tax=Phytohabitans flavus TaxID=1076124 RepID=A0A6F8XQB1_9ACTN|nr:hypothetical protein Pflav_023410 [Phytohabitans flavus]